MKIYFNNFWDNNINISKFYFWKHFFSLLKYDFTNNIKDADIVIYSIFFNNNSLEIYNNKINIFMTFEPVHIDSEYFNISLSFTKNKKNNNEKNNIICSPQMLLSIYNSEVPRSIFLKNRPYKLNIPKKFCCFITRVEKKERIHFFNELSKYKQVDSLGECLNNTGIYAPHDRYEFEKLVSQYKFIITFENCQKELYITEKILHGYYSMTIPIYWGSKHIHNFFNPNSFIYIDEYNDTNINNAIEKIKMIDKDDNLYLKIVNEPVFNNIDIDLYFNDIKNKISNFIDSF
jgi:hypothetical protein